MLASFATFTLGFGALLLGGPDAGGPEKIDSTLKPTYGSVKLKAGSVPDPFTKDLKAGGPIETYEGGVNAFVARAPDFVLEYEAGQYMLAISAESEADTTLLIQLPDRSFLANGDGVTCRSPSLRLEKPQSGHYMIWVGTRRKELADARLRVTEKEIPMEWAWQSKFPFDPEFPRDLKKTNDGVKAFIERIPPCKDEKDDVRGTPCEQYTVRFKQGGLYEIEMRAYSATFFPCLRLEKDGRQIKSASSRDKADDGSADEHTARMTYFCTGKGEFKIIATNYAGALGTFHLKVREHLPEPKDAKVGEPWLSTFDLKHMVSPVATAAAQFKMIEINDKLASTDHRDSVLRKSPCKTFWFEFNKGFTYVIDLQTKELRNNPISFDSVLRLEDDAGQELEFNDDRPGSTDSRITFKSPRTAAYRVIATSLNLYYQNAAGNPDLGCGCFRLVVTQMPTRDYVGQFIKEVMKTTFELNFPGKGKILYETNRYPLDVIYDEKTVAFAFQFPETPPAKETNDAWKARKNAWNEKDRLKIKESNGDVFPAGKEYMVGKIPYTGEFSFDKLKALHDRVMSQQLEFSNDEVKDLTARDVDIFIRYVMKTTYTIRLQDEKILCLTQQGFDVIYDRKAKTISFVFPYYNAPPEEATRAAWNRKGRNSRIEVSKGNLYKTGTVYFAGNPIPYADGISFARLKEFHDGLSDELREFAMSGH